MSCEQLRERLTKIKDEKPDSSKDFNRAAHLIESLTRTCPEGRSARTHTAALIKLGGVPLAWNDQNPPIMRRKILLNVDLFLNRTEDGT